MYRRGIEKAQLIKNVLDCCRQHGITGVNKTLLTKKKADILFRAWRQLQQNHRRNFLQLIGLSDSRAVQGTLFH